MKSVFSLYKPRDETKSIPLIFDSPHSGQCYPRDFHHSCPRKALEQTADHYVDELFKPVTKHGATLLAAEFPRCYIDTNRRIDDIDLALLDGPWPQHLPPHLPRPSARSDAGIGLIRRLIKPGQPVYDSPLKPQAIAGRIETYYRPYHNALEQEIQHAHYTYGQVWYINAHSMPDDTARPKRAVTLLGKQPQHSDFCLGNRDGTTCSTEFTHWVRDFLQDLGYKVTINDPFKGVELITRHGHPARGFHALQLEINKSLYMDEKSGAKHEGFPKLQQQMEALTEHCAQYIETRLVPKAAD